jgi:hypothetical protein
VGHGLPPDAQQVFLQGLADAVRAQGIRLAWPALEPLTAVYVDGVPLPREGTQISAGRHTVQIDDGSGALRGLWLQADGAEEVALLGAAGLTERLRPGPLGEGAAAAAVLVEWAVARGYAAVLLVSDPTRAGGWWWDSKSGEWSAVHLLDNPGLRRARGQQAAGAAFLGGGAALAVLGTALAVDQRRQAEELRPEMEASAAMYDLLIDDFGDHRNRTGAGLGVAAAGGTCVVVVAVIDSSPTLERLIVRENEAALVGGGISLTGSGTSLVDVRIEDNTAIEDGGGLHVEGSSFITIEHARVAGNQAEKGGGIRLIDGSDVVVHNAIFADNHATLKGGGVYIYSANATLDHVRITGNSSGEDGGGLRVRSSASATVSNGIIAGNLAANDGGGVHLIGFAEATLTNVVIVGNEAAASGGGIFVNLSSTIAYTNAEISSNTAATGGGVFTEDGATLTAVRSNAVANTPSQYDGAVADPTGTFGNVIQPPGYLDTSADDPSDWDLHLDLDSQIVDIGSADLTDPDGGPSDIGAYGGEGADGWDLDHDGYPEWWQPGGYDPGTHPGDGWDCDDTDPAVHAEDGC